MRAALFTRILLALLGLLARATSAEAECAWVLWNEVTYYGVDRAEPRATLTLIGAYPAYEQCQGGLGRAAQNISHSTPSSGPNVASSAYEVNGNTVTERTHLKDGRETVWTYRLLCLSDTADPRGPKGR
jgi:hypothetical protein